MLNRRETNLVTSVAEGAEVVRAVGHPSVRLVADLYHMVLEAEPSEVLDPVADLLAHVHVADTGRFAPGTGAYDYPGFFGALQRIGYSGRIAAENTWRDFPPRASPPSRSCVANGRPRLGDTHPQRVLGRSWRDSGGGSVAGTGGHDFARALDALPGCASGTGSPCPRPLPSARPCAGGSAGAAGRNSRRPARPLAPRWLLLLHDPTVLPITDGTRPLRTLPVGTTTFAALAGCGVQKYGHAARREYSCKTPPRRSCRSTGPPHPTGCPRGSGECSWCARCGRAAL